jgi:hypothetical protein
VGAGQGGAEVALGGGAAAVLAGERGASGNVETMSSAKKPKPVAQSPRCTASR